MVDEIIKLKKLKGAINKSQEKPSYLATNN